MPQQVDLGAPYGIVSYPDDYTSQQIVDDYDAREAQRTRDINRLKLSNARQADIIAEQQESRISENIALGVESGVAAAPIAAGHVLQKAAVSPWIRGATQSQIDAIIRGQQMPEREPDPEIRSRFGAPPAGLGLNFPTLSYIGRQLVDYGVGRQNVAREDREQIGGGISGAVAGSLAETATVSAQTLPFAVFGMGPAAIAAGLQSYGLQKEHLKQQLQQRNPGMSDDEAYRIADKPAALAGAITGGLTRVFGGTERLVNRIVDGRLKVEGVKGLIREANIAGGTEIPEEYLDQLSQGFIEKAYVNPDKTVSEIFNDAGMAGLTGYVLGAGTGASIQAPLAVASRVEGSDIVQASRVRRESRDESRKRISRVIEKREREANAETTTPPVTDPITQTPATTTQEADRSVRGPETQPGATIEVFHSTATEPGLGQRSGYYPGTYTLTRPQTEHGPVLYSAMVDPSKLYQVDRDKDADALKAEARDAGFGFHSGNGNSEVAYLKSRGFVGMRSGDEVILFSPEGLNATTAAPSPVATPGQSVVQEAIDTAFTPQPEEAPIAFVGRVVRDVITGWQNAPDIQLVDNGGQLPQEVQAKADADGVSVNDIDAVRDSKGTVWIVADKVRNADHARRLLLHEAVGHEGVDRAFGTQQDWTKFMQGVAQRHASTPLGEEIRGLYGNDPVTVGKEIVAKLAERPEADPTLWQQIVAAVRNWARRVFKVDISDNDIRVLLQRGRRAVESEQSGVIGRTRYFLESGGRILHAKNATVVGPASFAITALHGTRHKIPDRFKLEKVRTGEGGAAYGWGLYFADLLETAATYLTAGTRHGGASTDAMGSGHAAHYLRTNLGDRKKAIEHVTKHIANYKNQYGSTFAAPSLEVLEDAKQKLISGNAGNIYTVSLNVEPDELLDWDERLVDQPNINQRISLRTYPNEGYYSISPHLTGKEAYNSIREMLRGSLIGWGEIESAIDSSGHNTSELLEEFVSMQDEPTYNSDGKAGQAFSDEYSIEDQRKILEEISTFAPQIAIRLGGYAKSNWKLDDKRVASEYLRSIGIKGIKFLDQGSRGLTSAKNLVVWEGKNYGEQSLGYYVADRTATVMARVSDYYPTEEAAKSELERLKATLKQPTYNYVIFNDADITITHENGQPVPVREAMGGTSFALNPANQSWKDLPESTRDALRGPLSESLWQRNLAEAKRNALAHRIAWRDRVEAAAKAGQDVPLDAARSYFNAVQRKEFGADPQALELLRNKYPGEFESFAGAPGDTSFALTPESPPPIEGLQVAGAAAQVGRIAQEIYGAREAGGRQLEGLAYQRKQFKMARSELKRLSDLAYGRFGASAQEGENIIVPDPNEGVGIADGVITVDNTFVNTLSAVNVPHSAANVQALQAELFFEGAATRLNNLQEQIATLTAARQYYTELGVAPSEIEQIDLKLNALYEQAGVLSAAAHGTETVGGRASEIQAHENLRPQRMAQRAALSLEPVSEFFGRQVGGYREFVERVTAARELAIALRNAATDPAELARLSAEADRWLTLPDDVRAAIKAGVPLTDDQRAAAFASLAVVFDNFDLERARMKEIAASRLPEIAKEERELMLKIADFKVKSGMAEVMVADVLAALDGESGGTGTLQSQEVTQALRQRLSAIQTFALNLGENLETNRALFNWLANPTTPPVIPVGASYGVDSQTLAMILSEVQRNPAFGSAIVTLVAASQKKLANLPIVQLEQLQALVAAGNMDAARTLAGRLQARANARASVADSGLRERLKELDALNIERMALENGVSMFDELAAAPAFGDLRNAVSNSPYGLVEPMVAQNNTTTTFKPFGAPGIPSHEGLVMGADADITLKSEWFRKSHLWHEAAQHHIDAYSAALDAHLRDPINNPQPSALGFDLPKVRGLRDATQRYVPGSFLVLSLLSENSRWKVPRLVREMSKLAWFRQHDFVAKMVGGQIGTNLRSLLADFINHFLIARSIIQTFNDIPDKIHAAMKSHPYVQMNIANYREIFNELAHWGREFGSPVRVGLILPKSGVAVTAEDLALLKRQTQFEEALRRRVTETNPTAGIRLNVGGRELVRSAASVGDYGLPRHLNQNADTFISDVLTAYFPVGTPPVMGSFDSTTDLSATSQHPVVAFWNKNLSMLIQHVLDVRRGDRAMVLTPHMQAAELATESAWRTTRVRGIHSVEDLVKALVDHSPPMPGWNVRDRIIAGLNDELRQYRNAADKIAKERAEREQARTSKVTMAFSADNEFTRPAAKLELPSELYDYGALTPAEHLTTTSRANHERIVAYATAVQRAVSELENRLVRYRAAKGRISKAEAAASYGGDINEMKQVLGLLKQIGADFEAAYKLGNPSRTQSQWFREGFGLLTSAVLALPPVGLRNMTQGQFQTYVMSRAMGLAGNRLTMWRALKAAVRTVARFAMDAGLGAVRRIDIGAALLTGKNVQIFSKLVDQISSLILTPNYLAGAKQVHELGFDTRESFRDRMKRIWQETAETDTLEDLDNLTMKGRGVAKTLAVPVKLARAFFDRIGVQQYDQAINATLLTYATWLQRRMEEVALTYGAERERQGLTTFDATDPRWKLQPDEFGAFKSEQQNKDALGLFELFLELSANPEGFQLERNMWAFYKAHQAGGKPSLWTPRQFDAVQRRLLAEFNASTPGNRASAAAGNNIVRNVLTLQGYVSDAQLKLINMFGGSRDRTYLAATFSKLPMLSALALMSVLIGYIAAGLTGEWEKRFRGRVPALPNPFDRDFWTSWKRWGSGTIRIGMAQLFYIGEIVLAIRGEVQGNRGFDPAGKVWPVSIAQRGLAAVRGIWNTAKGMGDKSDSLKPLWDFGRGMLPGWLEMEHAFGASQGVIKQNERITRGEAQLQGLSADSRPGVGGPVYGPSTIVRRNIGEAVSAYWQAQQAGDTNKAEAALAEARAELKKVEAFYTQKYVKAGATPDEALQKAQGDVWSTYQDINPVVAGMGGKRPTAAQYQLLRSGMSGDRAAVFDAGVQAWQAGARALFGREGSITREDVEANRGGGGGGSVSIPSRAIGPDGRPLRAASSRTASRVTGSIGGFTPVSLAGTRRVGTGTSRLRRPRSTVTAVSRRRRGPRIGRATTRRRRVGTRRRRTYALA